MLYVPASCPVKVFDNWKVTPLSIEYSNVPFPVAVMIIEPSSAAIQVSSTTATLVIITSESEPTTVVVVAVQLVVPTRRTTTLYVPASCPVKILDVWKVAPLSIEYSNIPAPVAVIVIVPSSVAGQVSLVVITSVIMTSASVSIVPVLLAVQALLV